MYLTSLRIAFRGGVVVMALLSAAKLTDEVIRLVWRSGPNAAVDLKLRYAKVHDWFAGVPIYGSLVDAAYPPATYATLWPLLGWMSLETARSVWAATAVVALAWMACLVVRESGVTGGGAAPRSRSCCWR